MPESEVIRFSDAPMAADRTSGWDFVRSGGEVFLSEGAWYLTSIEAVQFAHRHPELFAPTENPAEPERSELDRAVPGRWRWFHAVSRASWLEKK